MKLTFSGSLAVFRPYGFMDADTTGLNLSITQKRLIASKNTTCVLLSLKYVAFFSPLWLGAMVTKLAELAKQIGASFAVCDYSDAMYDLVIKSSAKFTNFCLFESEQVAQIFFGEQIVDTQGKILLYHDNPEYRTFIEQALNKRGYGVAVASGQKEFLQLKPQHKFALSSKTRLVFSTKFSNIFIKDGVVIYCVGGLIDSNFVESFDEQMHARLLKTGFKFFAFWVNATSGLNMYGANFLIKLADESAKYGAMLALCGLNQASLSADLVANLRSSNTLLYKSLQEFFDDDSTIYVKNKRPLEIEPRHITKNIVEFLPSIIPSVLGVFSVLDTDRISVATKVQTYDYDEAGICGSAMFYGQSEMRFVLTLRQEYIEKIGAIFELDKEAKFALIFSLIIDKILEFFASKDINVKLVPVKICTQSFFDRTSKGAMIRLNGAQGELGAIFISK